MARGFITARVTGMRRVLRAIRLLPREVNDARSEALSEWARDLEKTAKDLAPVRRGVLRDHIESQIAHNAGVAFVRVVGGLDYPYYVEKGTSKMEAQPFLGPAAAIHRRTGERALQRIVPRRLGRG